VIVYLLFICVTVVRWSNALITAARLVYANTSYLYSMTYIIQCVFI